MDDEGALGSLIAFANQDSRVCPQPPQWNELWRMLPDRRRVGLGWQPGPPLILAAWWDSSVQSKRQRMVEHLTWAAENGALPEVDAFLRGLAEDAWLHERGGPA
jgi:hypothetical protein